MSEVYAEFLTILGDPLDRVARTGDVAPAFPSFLRSQGLNEALPLWEARDAV